MNEKQLINFMQQADRFISGKISQKEIDEIWIEMFKQPELLNYLITLASLRKFFSSITD